jgi:hypothetical protein
VPDSLSTDNLGQPRGERYPRLAHVRTNRGMWPEHTVVSPEHDCPDSPEYETSGAGWWSVQPALFRPETLSQNCEGLNFDN